MLGLPINVGAGTVGLHVHGYLATGTGIVLLSSMLAVKSDNTILPGILPLE